MWILLAFQVRLIGCVLRWSDVKKCYDKVFAYYKKIIQQHLEMRLNYCTSLTAPSAASPNLSRRATNWLICEVNYEHLNLWCWQNIEGIILYFSLKCASCRKGKGAKIERKLLRSHMRVNLGFPLFYGNIICAVIL